MEVEKRNEEIIAALRQEEIYQLQAGKPVFGDRPAPTMELAKLDVFPMKVIDPDDSAGDIWTDDRLERAIQAPLRAHFGTHGDIQLFVPAAKLTDNRCKIATLSKDKIETPGVDGKEREELLKRIPEEGILLVLGLPHWAKISDFFPVDF